MTVPPAGPFAAAGAALASAWEHGARVGESSVCSLCVHVLSAADPDTVTVLTDRDAGQTFYGRRRPAEIVHLDVFHTPGCMAPSAAAAAFREALAAYRRASPAGGRTLSPDWFDVQTAGGGGRVGGDLRGGRRETVLAAHRGHVHLAGRLGRDDAPFCLHLVAAVERALAQAGLPPRKPLRIVAAASAAAAALGSDLQDYAALTDSWLRQDGGGGEAASPGCAVPRSEEGLLAAAARLAEDLGGVEAARGLLDGLACPAPLSALRAPGWTPTRLRDALARLVQDGWAQPSGAQWRLTADGQALRAAFARRLREIELALRSAARRAAVSATAALPGAAGVQSAPRRPRGRRSAAIQRGDRLSELAVAETALSAAARCLPAAPLRFGAEDLRLRRHDRPRRVDLLLLLDASASMEGGRMRAAKTLARHLLLTSRDRVAVMAFQERGAVLAVPLTRNFAAAERGLRQVVPAGLTPLAAGLDAARSYLCRAHAKNPLLLLVTDGIPTVAAAGGSPLEEALAEAARLQGSGIALCCIGLEPNERYLAELARRAGGRLQVVAELRPELLAAVARRERLRRMEA